MTQLDLPTFRLQVKISCLLLLVWLAHPVQIRAAAEFRNAFDGSILNVAPQPGEKVTDAVLAFHADGTNPYLTDAAAILAGKKLYQTWCQSCHMPDGSGRIGPSLTGDTFTYERVVTDKGMFEVIFGGAGGAMQSFAKRISQDDMLKIIAYIRTLKK